MNNAKPQFEFSIWFIVITLLLLLIVTIAIYFILQLIKSKMVVRSGTIKETKIEIPEEILKEINTIVNGAKSELDKFDINNSDGLSFTDLNNKHKDILNSFLEKDSWKIYSNSPSSDITLINYVDNLCKTKPNSWKLYRK